MIKQLFATEYFDPIDRKEKVRFNLEDDCFPEFQQIAQIKVDLYDSGGIFNETHKK